MTYEVTIPWLDFGVKYAVFVFSVYYLFMRCVSEKQDWKKLAFSAFFSAAIGVSLIWLRPMTDPMHITMMVSYIIVTNSLLYRNVVGGTESREIKLGLSDIAALSMLCFAYCEALFMIVGFLSSVVLSVIYCYLVPEGHNSVWDFLNDVDVHITAYAVMISMVWVMTYLSARIRRFRRGLMNIVERRKIGTIIMTALLMLTALMAFGSRGSHENTVTGLRTALFVPTMLFCVAMIILTRLEIRDDYLMQIRNRNLLLLEGSLAEKDREISALVSDNENLARIIRRDSKLLGILSEGLRNGAGSAGINREAEALEKMYSGRCEAISLLEEHGSKIADTGVNSVDAILRYMAFKAEDKEIDFKVNVQSDMHGLIGEKINRREFNTILADLTENAIISAGAVKEKHVEVMLLRNQDSLCLEVFDSGERFDVGVLKNMGKRRITTHSGDGGSGIGLMTLFQILLETGASFTIDEFADSEKYHKAVIVSFDGAGRFRIITDRADELRQVLKNERFAIESKQKTV